MVTESFLWYCLTIHNPERMQAIRDLVSGTYSAVFKHSSSANQGKSSATAYRVTVHPLHNALLAIPPEGVNAVCKNNESSSSQTGKRKNLALQLTDVIVKAER